MNVSVQELRLICEQLFSHLENNGHHSIPIPFDYYWNIPKNQRYKVYQVPDELDIGQLTDDWLELQKIADGTREPIGYALVWLSAVMRAIGEQVVG